MALKIYIGGLVGSNSVGTADCLFLGYPRPQARPQSAAGTGKATAQMQMAKHASRSRLGLRGRDEPTARKTSGGSMKARTIRGCAWGFHAVCFLLVTERLGSRRDPDPNPSWHGEAEAIGYDVYFGNTP